MRFEKAEPYRFHIPGDPHDSKFGDHYGCFQVPGPCGQTLRIVAVEARPWEGELSDKWDHVSVSLANRTPNWQEMCFVKELFWDDEDTVVQYHPPKSQYVNIHERVLHLWRPSHFQIELPPISMV